MEHAKPLLGRTIGLAAFVIAAFFLGCRTTPPLVEELPAEETETEEVEAPAKIELSSLAETDDLGPIRAAVSDPNEALVGGWTALHAAAANGAYRVALLLAALGADVDAVNDQGETPLHAAAASDSPEVTNLLLFEGADFSATDRNGDTPLHRAVRAGAEGAARALASAGADFLVRNSSGRTPLGEALGDERMLDRVVTAENVNRVDANGRAPLLRAVRMENAGIVDALISRGANIDHRSDDGRNALDAALTAGTASSMSIAAGLMEAGARPGLEEFAYLVQPVQGSNPNVRTFTGWTPLSIAVDRGHASVVRFLIERGAEPTAVGPDGNTALHRAAAAGSYEIAAMLLDAGAVPDAAGAAGRTPLHLAPPAEAARFVVLLTGAGASLEARAENGNTVLLEAVDSAWPVDAVGRLLQAGASLTAAGRGGITALHLAVRTEQLELVEYLMRRGAPPFAKDHAGITPFHLVLAGPEAALRRFLTADTLTASDEEGNTALHIALSAGADPAVLWTLIAEGAKLEASNHRGETPLHVAVRRESLPAVDLLLSSGADLFARDASGTTPLGVAARLDSLYFKRLVDRDILGRTDESGNSPLHTMAQEGLSDGVIILLNRDSPVDGRNSRRRTPLHLASAADRVELIEILHEYGATLDARDENGDTPLHLAAADAPAAFSKLLSLGASVDLRNADGRSPLFRAVLSSRPAAALGLISAGASVDLQDNQGRAALHAAAEAGRDGVVTLLLSNGAAPGLRDNNGDTALHLALQAGATEVARRLVSTGANLFARNRAERSPMAMMLSRGPDLLAEVLTPAAAGQSDDRGNSALHLVVQDGYGVNHARVLIAGGVDANARNQEGATALHLAVHGDARELARFLIGSGADIHLRNNAGLTPLLLALQKGRDTAEWFVSPEIVNRADSQGNAALHHAAQRGYAAVVPALLEAGADVLQENVSGQTPRSLALQSSRQELADLLR